MTQVVAQPYGIKDTDDLTEIFKRLTDAKPARKEAQIVSKPTNTIAVTETAKSALEALSDRLRAVEVPSERRELTPTEEVALMQLVVTAKQANEAVEAAVEGVREAVFNDFDVKLEAGGDTSEYEIDSKGHYLVADELAVPEEGKRFTRELRESQPKLDASALRELWKSGMITREDYYEATKHVEVPRVIVEDQLAALLKRKPELLSKIASVLTPGNVSSAFYVRNEKKG